MPERPRFRNLWRTALSADIIDINERAREAWEAFLLRRSGHTTLATFTTGSRLVAHGEPSSISHLATLLISTGDSWQRASEAMTRSGLRS